MKDLVNTYLIRKGHLNTMDGLTLTIFTELVVVIAVQSCQLQDETTLTISQPNGTALMAVIIN